jgi:phosphohistidine swiveling domain-containing protein
MFSKWGLKTEDWFLANKFFFLPFLHDYSNSTYWTENYIYIRSKKIPWVLHTGIGKRTLPPRNSLFFKDFIDYLQNFISIELYSCEEKTFKLLFSKCDIINLSNGKVGQLGVINQLKEKIQNKVFKNKITHRNYNEIILDEELVQIFHLSYLYAIINKDLKLLKFLNYFHTNRPEKVQATIINNLNAKGYVRFLFNYSEKININKNDILVVKDTTNKLIPLMLKAGGIICEKGGINCHTAIICREFNLPGAVGVKDIYNNFRNGDLVELNPQQGFINIIRPFKIGDKISL